MESPIGSFFILDTANKPVTTMLTYPWKCTVLHCNHLGKTSGAPLKNQSVLSTSGGVSQVMTQHFDFIKAQL